MAEQDLSGRSEEADLRRAPEVEQAGIVVFPDLRSRLRVLQGGVVEPPVEVVYRDPVLDRPSFDNNFGVSSDPLHPYRKIDEDGVATIVPASERRFY